MPAYQATSRRPKRAVMPGVVADRSAHKGAPDTTLRLSECWRQKQDRRYEAEGHDFIHDSSPTMLAAVRQQ